MVICHYDAHQSSQPDRSPVYEDEHVSVEEKNQMRPLMILFWTEGNGL